MTDEEWARHRTRGRSWFVLVASFRYAVIFATVSGLTQLAISGLPTHPRQFVAQLAITGGVFFVMSCYRQDQSWRKNEAANMASTLDPQRPSRNGVEPI